MNERLNFTFKYLSLLILVLIAFSGLYSARGIYADGSFFLLSILKKNWFIADEAARSYAQIISQLPVITLLKLGNHDLNLLIRIYSVGLIFIPLSFWFVALLLHVKSNIFWIFMVCLASTYLSSGFFAIGEYNYVYSLSALSAAILFTRHISFPWVLVLTLCSFALMRCYEAMIFLGPLLSVFTVYRLIIDKHNILLIKAALTLSAIFFIASFYIALQSILHPHSPGNLSGALNFSILLKNYHFIYLSLMITLSFIGSLLRNKTLVLLISIGGLFLSILFVLSTSMWNEPNQHYDFRTLSGLFLFFILSIGSLLIFQTNTQANQMVINNTGFALSCFTLFLTLSVIFLLHTFQFYEWAKKYEKFAIINLSLTPIDQVAANDKKFGELNNKFNWTWTNPTLSILLRGNANAIILNQSSYSGWQPFDPRDFDSSYLSLFNKNIQLYK